VTQGDGSGVSFQKNDTPEPSPSVMKEKQKYVVLFVNVENVTI